MQLANSLLLGADPILLKSTFVGDDNQFCLEEIIEIYNRPLVQCHSYVI
jgi:hypothetical protein